MKTLMLKISVMIVGIFILSGCYTQLSEPITPQEYYVETDTVYQSDTTIPSDYNQGYRDGLRDFMNNYLWYGYNPDSYFYYRHRPYWDSPWSYYHSYYLGYYDSYFYDPFWDWGYYSYYDPYYYGYNSWYYHSYPGRYYYHGYYHHSGYTDGYTQDSEGRGQFTANRDPVSTSSGQANRTPSTNNSDLQDTFNLPMAAGGGKSSGSSEGKTSETKTLPTDIVKPDKTAKADQELKASSIKSTDKNIPGFQTTLNSPKMETKPIKTRSSTTSSSKSSSGTTKRTITTPTSKSSTISKSVPSSKTSATTSSSSNDTKSVSKQRNTSDSSSGNTSRSSSSSSSNSNSNSSSSSKSSSYRSSSSDRSSSSRSSSSSSSSSGSSRSSSSESSKSSSKKSR